MGFLRKHVQIRRETTGIYPAGLLAESGGLLHNPPSPPMNQAPKCARAVRLRAAAALSATALSATAGSYTNDFSGGAAGLTIYSIAGAAPEVRATDGNPGGYLKLTDAQGGVQSTVIFPDFDGGFPVQAFTFEVDCRIGNGTGNPADGFSINFAKTGDPVFLAGSQFNGAAEDGTTTGLSIGFDTYDNGNGDVVGFSIKNDGAILQEFPATTRNGAVGDATSLQTGPVGGAVWERFKVELKPDGNLDVTWKGVKVVDNLATGWTPSGGRMVFAARTGGEWQAHHFDNIAITTTPAPVAAVTSAKVSDAGYRFEISDFPGTSTVTQATVGALTIDGVTVTPTVSKTGTVTTVTYVPPTRVDYRSTHTYTLDFTDQASLALSGAGTLNAPTLPTGPLLGTTVAVNGTWNVREADLPDPAAGDNTFTEIGLAAGKFLALAPGEYTEQSFVNYINFSDPQDAGDKGMFKLDTPFLNNTDAGENYILQGSNTAVTITGATPAELRRTFQVQSDDGFALRVVGGTFTNKAGGGIIDPADSSTLIFPGGTGNSNTRGLVQFPAAGDYTVEFLHFEGAGGAFNEVSWANGDFVNNPDATTWKLVGGETEIPLIGDVIPATGTGAPVGQWNLRVLRDTGGQAGTFAGALAYLTSETPPNPEGITDAVSPVINYSDLDGTRGAPGLFNNDIGLIGNLAGEDNDFITVGRITVPVPAAGYYTLEGLADDGFLVKLVSPGSRFVSTSGPGGLDPLDTTTFYNPGYTDVATLGVAYFDAPGNYDILFLSQEGGGGASGEIAFAPGRHGSIGATSEWQLLGDSSTLTPPTPLFPTLLPGPDGGAGVWGIRFIRGVPAQGDSVFNAVNSARNTPGNGGMNTDGTAPYLNYSDVDGTPGQENMGLFRGNNVDNNGLYAVADENYLGSTGEDDQIVAVAKARMVIPTTGEWTFGIHSDDGIALRIKGAVWKRVTGDNWIDPALRDTFFFRYGTGDSNARGVTDLTAGEYDIELVWFEGGVGSNFELYAAQGAFANDVDTPNWRLVGGPNDGLVLVAAAAPTDPNFLISTVSYNAATSVVTISFPSEAGVSYGVEWSTSLTDAPWASAGTVTGTAGTTTTTVNAATLNGGTAPTRFFVRVRELTPQ